MTEEEKFIWFVYKTCTDRMSWARMFGPFSDDNVEEPYKVDIYNAKRAFEAYIKKNS